MAIGDTYVFPAFLTLVLTKISFKNHLLLFSHASAEVKGKKYAGKKVCLNQGSNSQPSDHESDTLTTEPPRQGARWTDGQMDTRMYRQADSSILL